MGRVELDPHWFETVNRAAEPAIGESADWIAWEASRIARTEAYGEGVEGHYADQIEARVLHFARKSVAKVEAAKHTAGWIESGTVRMEGLHVLDRAARASGLPTRSSRRRGRRGRGRRRR